MNDQPRHQKSALIAFALSFLTLIGGHAYTGRTDRTIFFTGSTILILATAWTLGPSLFSIGSSGQAAAETGLDLGMFLKGFAALYLLIVSISGLVAARDARRPFEVSPRAQRLGALFLSICFGVLGVLVLSLSFSIRSNPVEARGEVDRATDQSTADNVIRGSVHLGGGFARGTTPETAPQGAASFLGRVRSGESGLGGATVSLLISGRYEAEARTGTDGVFAVSLPAGKWRINSLSLEAASPTTRSGEAVLRTGLESRLQGEQAYHAFEGGGFEVEASERPTAPAIDLTVVPPVELEWPAATTNSAVEGNVTASIRWRPYPDAISYQVEISEVERHSAGSRSWHAIQRHVQSGTALPVATLPALRASGRPREYQIKIYAFDADGAYLSESLAWSAQHSFLLQDVALIEQSERERFASEADLLQARQNTARLSAIEQLVADGMPDSAAQLMQKVRGARNEARFLALSGYIEATKGNCPAARDFFTRAARIDRQCMSDHYWHSCPIERLP